MTDTPRLDYPRNSIGYSTLTGPATFTQYCYPPNCSTNPFPYHLYDAKYTAEQMQRIGVGLNIFMDTQQTLTPSIGVRNLAYQQPVFNSNTKPLQENYLRYC